MRWIEKVQFGRRVCALPNFGRTYLGQYSNIKVRLNPSPHPYKETVHENALASAGPVAGVMLTTTVFVVAQTPLEDKVVPPPYRPSLADLMSATVQPRHAKLAFAGREKNWVFAAYELKQLSDAFDRLSLQWPQWRQQRMVELVETIVRDPLFELDFAIKNKDEAKFAEYYGHLTDACNACHQAALQTPVVIQDPKESMFPNQDFRPKP
jgi:hypothetical protein